MEEKLKTILQTISDILQEKGRATISIDGMCGSGKTTLAEEISTHFSARTFHVDDYYLPLEQRKEGWEREGGSNIDFERFLEEVLLPAERNETVIYCPYSCSEKRRLESVEIENRKVSIVEGSYSQHPCLAPHYDLKIFLYCSEEVQKERLMAREGDYFQSFEKRWIPMENQYFQAHNIKESSDIQLESIGKQK